MISIRLTILLQLLIIAVPATAQGRLPDSYIGEWKAYSRACVPGSVLKITDKKLQWVTQKHTDTYEYFENSEFFPVQNVPENTTRHTLKIVHGRDILPGRSNFISLAIHTEIGEFRLFKKDQILLSVWWHDYGNDNEYFVYKRKKESNASWCLFTK